ncbi:zincin-like metallopeptidase domain-containing protein [Psychromonas aquatilis]|uniref:Zincin-like metallopeptidase domain-containing protein n=1 Tax=Psychromonas aquatilis TaxID=2005072 RepID=A0ABU9GRK3_9GAMM
MADINKKKKYKPGKKWNKNGAKKPSANEIVLTKLKKIMSTPRGEWDESDDDIKVSFYKSKVSGQMLNFDNKPYSGLNTLLLEDAMHDLDKNVGCFATGLQLNEYFKKNKDLIEKTDDFDPEKPLKGLSAVSPIFKWNKTYYKDGKAITDEDRIKELDLLSKRELEDRDISKYQGMKRVSSVFAIEDLKEHFPKEFIDERPYFKKAEELSELRMNPEKESEYFCEMAEIIIKASEVEVIEKEGSNRAYYSPMEDHIVIPPRHRFESDEARLAVILHELSHSTGHSSRLNRDFAKKEVNGKKEKNFEVKYASEEVIAETSTAFLTARFGIKSFNSHAKYIQGYCNTICANNNEKALIRLSTKAMAAANYLGDKVDAYMLKLEQEVKLKAEIDQDLTPKDLIVDGAFVIQTVALSKNPEKTFKVAIDINERENLLVDNAELFNEYQNDKHSNVEPEELEKTLKDNLKGAILIQYDENKEFLKSQEIKRNEYKETNRNEIKAKNETMSLKYK